MASFGDVESVWSSRLGSLRNVIRQRLIERQLGEHLDGIETALDVGCGQGTQTLALASHGIETVGVDPSEALLSQLTAEAARRQVTVATFEGRIENLSTFLGDQRFDLVCAHGLLMYLDDAEAAVSALAGRLHDRGLLSITFRNKDALAYRAAIRGDWRRALSAFDESQYVYELGATANAHSLDEVSRWCRNHGLTIEAWYGVRVFTDGLAPDQLPESLDFDECFVVELEAGRRDPYRRLGSQLHIIARRP